MVSVEAVLKEAIARDASDVHFIVGIKPTMRIRRDLIPIKGTDVLTDEDMYEIYDYFIRGNVEKDEIFRKNRIRFICRSCRTSSKGKYVHGK